MKNMQLNEKAVLLEKYYAFYERQIASGKVSPLSGMERITLEMMISWLCERYNIVHKQKQN